MGLFQVSDILKGSGNDPIVQLAVLTCELVRLQADVRELKRDVEELIELVRSNQRHGFRSNWISSTLQALWTTIALLLGLRYPR